jgi:hypothetical protein
MRKQVLCIRTRSLRWIHGRRATAILICGVQECLNLRIAIDKSTEQISIQHVRGHCFSHSHCNEQNGHSQLDVDTMHSTNGIISIFLLCSMDEPKPQSHWYFVIWNAVNSTGAYVCDKGFSKKLPCFCVRR